MNGSVLKLNHARDPLPVGQRSAIQELRIAREGIDTVRRLFDPDGNRVVLVRKGEQSVVGIAVVLRVSDLAASDRFYVDAMGFDRVETGVWRCGDSLIVAGEQGAVEAIDDWRALGFRYLTVQVWDCVAEYAGALARGAREGRPPVELGSTVRYAFVRDPDGTFIEISQRASLTGGAI